MGTMRIQEFFRWHLRGAYPLVVLLSKAALGAAMIMICTFGACQWLLERKLAEHGHPNLHVGSSKMTIAGDRLRHASTLIDEANAIR